MNKFNALGVAGKLSALTPQNVSNGPFMVRRKIDWTNVSKHTVPPLTRGNAK
jgi:hypothetical protein